MTTPRLIARFHPERETSRTAGITDVVRDGDPVEVDVTLWSLSKGFDFFSQLYHTTREFGRDLDMIAEASDVLLRRHRGPYTVDLEPEDILEFLQANGIFASLDEASYETLRKRYGVQGDEIPHPVDEPMFAGPRQGVPGSGGAALRTEISDWRIEDGSQDADDLTEDQRRPWQVEVAPGASGISLELVAPDGTRRAVSVEIDSGNPRFIFYSSRDESDVTVTLGRDSVHVRADQSPSGRIQSVVFDEDGMRDDGTDRAAPDFTTPQAGPAP